MQLEFLKKQEFFSQPDVIQLVTVADKYTKTFGLSLSISAFQFIPKAAIVTNCGCRLYYKSFIISLHTPF